MHLDLNSINLRNQYCYFKMGSKEKKGRGMGRGKKKKKKIFVTNKNHHL